MGIFAGAVDYFQRGGACMWPLLLCSLAAIAIGVERYLYYKKALSSTDFVMEFCHLMNDFNIVGAREFAGMNNGDAAELAVETLDINEDLGKRLESIVYSKADRAIDGMEQNLDYLSVVIGLAPMLGLLGTITGMISSFNALNERAQNPMAVTAGIGINYKINDRLAVFAEPGVSHHFSTDSKLATVRTKRPTNFNLLCGLRMTY